MANKPNEPETKQSETKSDIPEALNDKQIKTKVTSIRQKVKDILLNLKDLATLEIMLPVIPRMRARLESITKLSQATHIKVQNQWKTTSPRMHIRKLEGKKINNDEVRITFEVYKTDDAGNKLMVENKVTEVIDGREVEKVQSVDYPIDCEVTEIIRQGKPIEREVMKLNEA